MWSPAGFPVHLHLTIVAASGLPAWPPLVQCRQVVRFPRSRVSPYCITWRASQCSHVSAGPPFSLPFFYLSFYFLLDSSKNGLGITELFYGKEKGGVGITSLTGCLRKVRNGFINKQFIYKSFRLVINLCYICKYTK